MSNTFYLKPLERCDHNDVREIYTEAIESQGKGFYTPEQIRCWADLAWLPGFLDRALIEGKGWISVENENPQAFAVRYPFHRLALLYCRGVFARRGHATALLDRVELEACQEGHSRLVTEVSLLSYSLLLRREWVLLKAETIYISGVEFDRFRMQKILNN